MILRIELSPDGLATCNDFRDCECAHDHIKPEREESCDCCESFADDQPDSRLEEVLSYYGGTLKTDTIKALEILLAKVRESRP